MNQENNDEKLDELDSALEDFSSKLNLTSDQNDILPNLDPKL